MARTLGKTIRVFLHYEATTNQLGQLTSSPVQIALTKISGPPGLPSGMTKYKTSNGVCTYGFDSVVKDKSHVLLVQMNLPRYFNEMSGMVNDIQGIFLVGLRNNTSTRGVYRDMQHGSLGCPNLIHIGDLSGGLNVPSNLSNCTKNRFTFNNMSFHPFVMINMTIGYYVCDQGGACDWPDSETREALAVDQPIVYDATLGLYLTRGAHLVANKSKKKPK